jgi:hypothetical protein
VLPFKVKGVPENTALMRGINSGAESRPLVEIQVQFLRLNGYCGSLLLKTSLDNIYIFIGRRRFGIKFRKDCITDENIFFWLRFPKSLLSDKFWTK